MGNVLMLSWNAWDVPQKLMCMVAILVPFHVFEENAFPGGFYYMNNIGQKSDAPLVYPQNRLTNMITNLGAEILFICLTFLAPKIPAVIIVVVIVFGFGEAIHHTMDGFHAYSRYRSKGKKTLYTPGVITSYIGLLELSVYGCYWLTANRVTVGEVLGGIGIVLFIVIGLILIPFAISRKVKSQKYAFQNKGYFEKYE